ncbi:uncharacterized protein N7469_004571 [Penicillium citrinum]|uniref:Uncharacterized protein n=1 Tax=Penicillium citrinum TaxID=5077 RepID=A0A9W9TRB7_PENCI|nr:uncharacterized protein N7469_004571 [Penicillium citrinum]KAJ5235403.1 hypothetical protein N7469_004571 [Penicillium citrinum]
MFMAETKLVKSWKISCPMQIQFIRRVITQLGVALRQRFVGLANLRCYKELPIRSAALHQT